jgi:hypothetical protein
MLKNIRNYEQAAGIDIDLLRYLELLQIPQEDWQLFRDQP